MIAVFDVEADGLLKEATKLHVLSYQELDSNKVISLTDYQDMRDFFEQADVLIGHNIVQYDIPVIEKLLDIKVSSKLVDTLALSWYLFPLRNLHGLESWGDDIGIAKPEIDDWQNLSVEEYIHRCSTDVRINMALWKKMDKLLRQLYVTKDPLPLPIVSYLTFKMDCAREQARSKWKLNKPLAQEMLDKLQLEQASKIEALLPHMPKVPIKAKRNPPAKPFKKDGTLSVEGAKWFNLLSDMGLDKSHSETISVITGYNEPNPGSHVQVKDWLFSLGWEPCTIKYEKEPDGSFKEIPQVRVPKSGGELTPSVRLLAEREPAILILEGLSIIQHRISVFAGFLSNVDEDGYVKAEIGGLTNTLRFKHREPCVNLPGVDKPYGKEIRACLIACDGYELCGADMVSLEATTKRHYMYPYDPDYADAMGEPTFDEHLDVAVAAGAITKEQMDDHIAKRADFSKVRKKFKPVNYSAIYGIGSPKLSREIGCTVWEAQELLDAYWVRNWAIKKVAEEQVVKTVGNQKWLLNPVNGFWYSLRADKDRFSTLNQGTGSYLFDKWVAEVRARRSQMTAQFHDEGVWELKKGNRDRMSALLQEAIDSVNAKVKLNVTLKIDIKYGDNYAAIH